MTRKEHTADDFTWTQWDAGTIRELGPAALARKREVYAKIKAIPDDKRTFENTVWAIEASHGDLADQTSVLHLLFNTSPDEATRAAARETVEMVEKELVEIEADEDLYKAVQKVAQAKPVHTPEDQKLLNDMLRGYRRLGLDLPLVERAKLNEHKKMLTGLVSEFAKNINDHDDAILVTREALEGLPEHYIRSLTTVDGKYRISLAYPEYGPFMQYGRDPALRKQLADKNFQKGGSRNIELLKEMITLRQENARLLGYPTHAAYQTEVRTVKTPERVWMFLDDLTARVGEAAEKDIEALRDLKRRETGDADAPLLYYDVSYWAERLQEERFRLDSQKVREYFPFAVVKEGMFRIYEKVLSVRFERVNGVPLWHEDAELYAVRDQDGSFIGSFALDLYPRRGKYTHAAVFPVKKGRLTAYQGDAYAAPFAAMVANFPKPSPEVPSLLSHHEAEVFFHEFGHVVHEVLTAAPYASQSGSSVAWDFVEAPSQMLEHWVWDKEALGMLSGHYTDTSRKLPDDMLKSLLAAKYHLIGYATMRQLIFARFDMLLHTEELPEDINALYAELVLQYAGITLPEGQRFAAGFGHFQEYDAGYYGYLWSKVFAADMFTRFEKAGLFDRETGMDYRRWILEKGSSREELDLVRGFLGREPNNEAFLKEVCRPS